MAGYPAHAHAAAILENLKAASEKADGDVKARIEKAIADLDPIKDNKTFMRTQKAERIAEGILANSVVVKESLDLEKLTAVETDITELVEKVKSFIIRMT